MRSCLSCRLILRSPHKSKLAPSWFIIRARLVPGTVSCQCPSLLPNLPQPPPLKKLAQNRCLDKLLNCRRSNLPYCRRDRRRRHCRDQCRRRNRRRRRCHYCAAASSVTTCCSGSSTRCRARSTSKAAAASTWGHSHPTGERRASGSHQRQAGAGAWAAALTGGGEGGKAGMSLKL